MWVCECVCVWECVSVCVCVWVFECVYECVCSVVSNSCNPVDCTSPGYPVHGISQARKQKWVAISFSRGLFPTPGSNWNLLYLLRWQADSLPLSHLGSPLIPWPGLKPRPPALRAQSLATGPPGKSQSNFNVPILVPMLVSCHCC